MGSGIYNKHHCFTCIGDDDNGRDNICVYADSREDAENIYIRQRYQFPVSVRYYKTLLVANGRHKQNRRERVALAG